MSREHQIRFPDKFWRRETHLSTNAKSLYSVLATFADYRTGETFVGNVRLQLETGYGRDKVKELLSELERAGFISRRRGIRRNLKAKRYIRCLKYVVSPIDGNSDYRADGLILGTTENKPIIFSPVKSSVTPKEQEKSSFPRNQEIPEGFCDL